MEAQAGTYMMCLMPNILIITGYVLSPFFALVMKKLTVQCPAGERCPGRFFRVRQACENVHHGFQHALDQHVVESIHDHQQVIQGLLRAVYRSGLRLDHFQMLSGRRRLRPLGGRSIWLATHLRRNVNDEHDPESNQHCDRLLPSHNSNFRHLGDTPLTGQEGQAVCGSWFRRSGLHCVCHVFRV